VGRVAILREREQRGTKRGDDKWDPHGDRVIASLLDYL
jgi:hypothetical protein